MNKTKIVIPFEPFNTDIPIIKFFIDDCPRYAVLDTGAESTVFDVSIRDAVKIVNSEEISIVGISTETKVNKIEIAQAKIWMHNNKDIGAINIQGYISDISHLSSHFLGEGNGKVLSAIIGSDVLNKFHSKIDFVKQEIIFHI